MKRLLIMFVTLVGFMENLHCDPLHEAKEEGAEEVHVNICDHDDTAPSHKGHPEAPDHEDCHGHRHSCHVFDFHRSSIETAVIQVTALKQAPAEDLVVNGFPSEIIRPPI